MLYSAATVAGNVTAAGPSHLAQAVHAIPAVTMVLAWHLLSRFFAGGHVHESAVAAASGHGKTGRLTRSTRKRHLSPPSLDEVAVCVADLKAAGQKATGNALATRFGVSDRTGRRMLVDIRSRRIFS